MPALNTNDYAVVANFSVPAGSLDSGIVARGSASGFSSDLYAAQISTSGAVNLFRRNAGTWTQLGTFATTIQANVFYNLKLLVSGSTTVHLEVWFNGTRVISFDDGSVNAIKTGVPGIENYDPNIKYDAFAVYPPS